MSFYTIASEVIRESLRLMHTYDALQKQRLTQLNEAIEAGLDDLKAGRTVSSSASYKHLSEKIGSFSKGKNNRIHSHS